MAGLENLKTYEQVKTVDSNGDKVVDDQGLKNLNVVLSSHDVVDATKKIAEKLDKCDKIDLLKLVSTLPITEANKGDIQNFLDHMKHNLPSETATTSLDADQQELKTLSDTLKNNIIAYNNSKKVVEVSKQQNSPSSQLEKQMSMLKENDILQFNGVIDDLQKGLLPSEKVQSFTNMISLLRLMNGLPKDQIITIVDEVISKQFPDKKDNPEIKFFKDTLSVMLDKGLIGNFINQVDTDLHNNEKLKGISYDKLLDPSTDLSSPEAKAAISNIFNTDEELFNKFIADFKNEKKFIDPLKDKRQEIQKVHMQDIIKEYIKSDFPNEDLSGIIIQTGQVELKNSQGGSYKKDCFNIMKNDKIMEVSIGKDENGKDKIHKLTPFFGDAKYGKAIPMEQCLTSNLMKDMLGKNNLEMQGTADAMKKLVSVNDISVKDNPKSFSEAIKGFFDHPLFKQLQEALYTLMGLIGTDEQREKAALDLNRMRSLNTIKARGESIVTRKDPGGKLMIDVIKDNDYGFKTDEVIQYKDKNGNEKSVKINTKNIFTNMTYEEQKLFLENILSGDAQKVQAAKDSMIAIHNNENPISTNTDKSKDETSEKKEENSTQGKELISGQSYDLLKINPTMTGLTGKLEISQDKKFLTIDDQVVMLKESQDKKTLTGVLRVKDNSIIGFVEHIITMDVATGKISCAEGNQAVSLDVKNNSDINTVYENGKLKLPIAVGKENLFNYFVFSRSVDSDMPNKIDAIYTALAQDPIAMKDFQTRFAKLQSDIMLSDKKQTSIINLIDKSGLNSITCNDATKQGALTAALDNRKALFTPVN